MKRKYKIVIFPLVIFVLVLCFNLKSEVKGVTSEEAGKYIAEFAINFFDAHANETYYNREGARKTTYTGQKNSNGKYGFDCVGWVSFALHQSLGIGNQYFTEFAIPYHGNKYPGFSNGIQLVYGKGGSGNAISIDELKQQLKPGDILLKTAQHVLIYVGDGTLIHCNGHGPGPEYGGDLKYGLTKETLDHFYKSGFGIEAIGRITEDAASKINESNLTTVFGESGKALTGKWQSASNNTSSGGWDNGTSNNEGNSSTNYTSTQKVIEAGFQADYNLGLIYPKDNKNTPLNSFLDFTLPYLQTWMIPLAMNSGAVDTAGSSDKGKNPVFGYITLKEAMSDIIIDRYDITKCTLKTRYKVYDIIEYEVVTNSNGVKSRREIRRTHVDESSNGPMAEEYISKNFDVNTKYCIKKAHTFDVKIDNDYTYNKYSDSDVDQRINPKTENKEKGEKYEAGGDPGGDEEHTYWVRVGYYVNVTRTWEDEFEIGESHIDTYDVEDVEDYINNFTLKKNNLSGNTNSSSGTSTDGTIFNCKKYELTEAQKQKLAKMVFAEFGANEEGAKAVASHMCNLYEYSVWAKITKKSFYDFIVNSKWFAAKTRSNQQYDDYSLQAVEQCIVNGQRTIAPYVIHYGGFAEMYQKFSGQIDYIKIDGKHGSNRAESRAIAEAAIPHQSKVRGSYSTIEGIFYKVIFAADGYNGMVLFYSENYKNACESSYTTTETNTPSSSNSSNSNNSNNESSESQNNNIDVSGLEEFDYNDRDYYKLLKVDNAINRVDMANAKPENYLQYMRKGSQYSNHVGYSRGYLVYGYGELKRLFRKYFENNSTLPFVYGSSLGYDTYTAERVLDAGTFEINGESASSGNGNGNDLVKVALEEVGYLEKKSNSQLDDKKANAGNNNYTKYGAWFGLNGGPSAPWCNIFVSWCADQLGLLDNVIPRSAGCSFTWQWFKSRGLTHLVTDTSYTPKPGDLVLRGPGEHIGIVEKFEDGVLYTIEGNTSGQGDVNEGNGVYEKKYSNPSASWYGYCSPEYPTTSSASLGNLSGTGIDIGTEVGSSVYNNSMKYIDTIKKYSSEVGVDPYMVVALMTQETGGRNITNNKYAIGLMMFERNNFKNGKYTLSYTTVNGEKQTVTFTDSQITNDTDLQIRVGTAMFKNKIEECQGNILVALQSYNYGSGGIKRCITHHISGGKGSGKFFGVSDTQYKEYLASGDTGWLSSRTWYTSTGCKAFGNAGGGDKLYVEHVLRFYNASGT